MQFLSVKPAPGRSPRHETPPHAPIAAAGELVPATPFYLRQMEVHGDTVNAEPHPAVAYHLEPVDLVAAEPAAPAAEILEPAAPVAARPKPKPKQTRKLKKEA